MPGSKNTMRRMRRANENRVTRRDGPTGIPAWPKRPANRPTRALAPIYTIRRTYQGQNIAGLNVAGSLSKGTPYLTQGASAGGGYYISGGSIFFCLQDIADYTQFTSLFERYRISRVKVTWMQFDTITGLGGVVTGNVLHDCFDYDDAVVPTVSSDTGIQYLREKDSYMMTNLTAAVVANPHGFSRTLIPQAASPAYQASSFAAYTSLPPGTWIDTAYPAVQHYSYKFIIGTFFTGNGNLFLPLTITADLEFTGLKSGGG